MIITLTIIIILTILFIFLPIFTNIYISTLWRVSLPKAIDIETKRGVSLDIEALHLEPLKITLRDGYVLNGSYAAALTPSNRYVIFSHGYTYNSYGSIKYLHIFRQLGFNCILYDSRGHGKNKRCHCSFGLKEGQDLVELINYVRKRFGQDIILGLHGESMGSGIEISSLAYKPSVDFVVNDCGYAYFGPVLEHKAHQMFHLPGWYVHLVDCFARLLFGYSYYDINPIDSLKNNTIPICFIHGTADDFIFPEHSVKMSQATTGYNELHFVEGATHAACLYKDPDNYCNIVKAFLKNINIL